MLEQMKLELEEAERQEKRHQEYLAKKALQREEEEKNGIIPQENDQKINENNE